MAEISRVKDRGAGAFQLRHPNLVRLIGYCFEDEQEGFLVYKFMVNGNLKDTSMALTPITFRSRGNEDYRFALEWRVGCTTFKVG